MAIGIWVAAFDVFLLGPPRHCCSVPRRDLLEENLTRSVIGAFFEVYNNLGFGFLEHLYVMALERELMARGHQVGGKSGLGSLTKERSLVSSAST